MPSKGDTVNADTVGAAGKAPVDVGAGATPLTIGAVTFRTEECPSELAIGAGEQMEVSTQLVGGGRVVQVFGSSADDVTWSGTFYSSPQVRAKVQSLRLYMVTGQEVLLKWGSEQYYVRVKKFTPRYHGTNLCSYDISVVVTRDANGAFTVNSNVSIDSQIQALLAEANKQNNVVLGQQPTAAQVFQQKLAALQSAVNAAGPIAQNITVVGPPIIAASNAASQSVGDFITGLTDQTNPAYAGAVLLQSSLNAITENVQRGQTPKSIQVQGTDLMAVAAQQYGDATLGYQLAKVNGLPSPFTTSAKALTITLPPFLG